MFLLHFRDCLVSCVSACPLGCLGMVLAGVRLRMIRSFSHQSVMLWSFVTGTFIWLSAGLFHHTYLPNNTPPQDSFCTNIKQILILQGEQPMTSIYFRSSCRSCEKNNSPYSSSTRHSPYKESPYIARRREEKQRKDKENKSSTKVARIQLALF